MLFHAEGNAGQSISPDQIKEALFRTFDRLGVRKRVLAVPPDCTRIHSRAGDITCRAFEYYGSALTNILPATGTHHSLTLEEKKLMFPGIPPELFAQHSARAGCRTLGTVPASFVKEVSEGMLDWDWPVTINSLIAENGFDLILSIGQVVPHEVAGMANYDKNILIGTGGIEAIDKSHFLGAVFGMERIMGRLDNPVRQVFQYASEKYLKALPIVYILTVIGQDGEGKTVVRGIYIGDDRECFSRAAELSREVNITLVETPLEKIVAYLDPAEFKSAWLCNKAIYRTRLALADNGTLVILAPGMEEFGEDRSIDKLIRKYGYTGRDRILEDVRRNEDLAGSLCAAAHLIHGSTEGRFNVVYCPGKMTREEIEKANYSFGDVKAMLKKYDPEKLCDGFQETADNEKIFFISKPALGLWAWKKYLEK